MKHHFMHSASESRTQAVSATLTHSSTLWDRWKTPVRGIGQILLFLLAVQMLTGCATAQSVSNDSTFSISSLENALQDQPEVRAELLHTSGTLLNDLSDHEVAKSQLIEALDILRSQHGDEHPDVVMAMTTSWRGSFSNCHAACR